jgi:Ala-tRNA(Pro) deacylase
MWRRAIRCGGVANELHQTEANMPILTKLKEVLDKAKIPYEIYNHPQAFTAQETAASQHLPGQEMAKVVMLKVDGSLVMAVVPASTMVSYGKVRASLRVKEVALATEDEFVSKFPECEIGAMPPFGNLFGLPVYVDPALEKDEMIFFNAGNHLQTVRLKYSDFAKLVRPNVVSLIKETKSKAA